MAYRVEIFCGEVEVVLLKRLEHDSIHKIEFAHISIAEGLRSFAR